MEILSELSSKADLVAESALSFPLTPMWLGIQRIIIFLWLDIASSLLSSLTINAFSSFLFISDVNTESESENLINLLYLSLCCIATMISITTVIQIHIQIQAGIFRFGYERVYLFLASVHGDTRREAQFLKAYANQTMLTPPQRAAHLVMFKISIHLCRSRSKNLTARLNGRKPKCHLFQNLQILKTIFSGPAIIHIKLHFLSGGFIMTTIKNIP